MAREFFPEAASSADCPVVSVQPPCAIAGREQFARQKSQTLAAIPLSGHTKILHTQTGVGSAALAAAVPYLPRYGDRNFPQGTKKY